LSKNGEGLRDRVSMLLDLKGIQSTRSVSTSVTG